MSIKDILVDIPLGVFDMQTGIFTPGPLMKIEGRTIVFKDRITEFIAVPEIILLDLDLIIELQVNDMTKIEELKKKLSEAKSIKKQAEDSIQSFAVTAKRRKEEIKRLEALIEAEEAKNMPTFHLTTIQAVGPERWLQVEQRGQHPFGATLKTIEPQYLLTFQSSGYGENYLYKLTKEKQDLLQAKIMELLKNIEL